MINTIEEQTHGSKIIKIINDYEFIGLSITFGSFIALWCWVGCL